MIEHFTTTIALIGIVILVASLLSGVLERSGVPLVADARADRNYSSDDVQAAAAVRLDPEDPVRDATAQRLSQRATLVVYCA